MINACILFILSAIFYDTSVTLSTTSFDPCISVQVQDDNTYTSDQRVLELQFSLVHPNDMFIGDSVVKVTVEDDGKWNINITQWNLSYFK